MLRLSGMMVPRMLSKPIRALKPNYFTKGGDRAKPEDVAEWDICQEIGCEVIFNVGGGKVQSSSWLVDGKGGNE